MKIIFDSMGQSDLSDKIVLRGCMSNVGAEKPLTSAKRQNSSPFSCGFVYSEGQYRPFLGNPLLTRVFPYTGPIMWRSSTFVDVSLRQLSYRWFKTPWRLCAATVMGWKTARPTHKSWTLEQFERMCDIHTTVKPHCNALLWKSLAFLWFDWDVRTF